MARLVIASSPVPSPPRQASRVFFLAFGKAHLVDLFVATLTAPTKYSVKPYAKRILQIQTYWELDRRIQGIRKSKHILCRAWFPEWPDRGVSWFLLEWWLYSLEKSFSTLSTVFRKAVFSAYNFWRRTSNIKKWHAGIFWRRWLSNDNVQMSFFRNIKKFLWKQ